MAARRLILVMLVLLVLSSAVAALIPVEGDEAGEETTETTTTRAEPAPTPGELVTARLRADASKPERIEARRGDQLELTVSSSKPGQVEILALGVFEEIDPLTPVEVDLLLIESGTYPVRLHPPGASASGRLIGRIVVGPPAERSEGAA